MTTSRLDLSALTAPLDGDQPAGIRLPADVRKKMEDARKDFEPDPNDPSAPPLPKKPDWAAIIRMASDSLSKKSKDLLAAVRLVEALTQRDSFEGLREGLTLVRLLLTECWDRVHPLIEEPDDLEARAGPLQWLCDTESGAWFPTTVARLPLLKMGGQTVSLQDCRAGQYDGQPLSSDAMRNADPADPNIAVCLAECLKEIDTLDQSLTEKMADHAPSLGGLRDVLIDCARYVDRPASGVSEMVEEASTEASALSEPGTLKANAATSRADMYRQLAKLADDLARAEPHSPIPDLLRWACTLGAMPFRQLIQELVREPGVLEDIRRQLGIKESPPPES